jgi:hypothetical protein
VSSVHMHEDACCEANADTSEPHTSRCKRIASMSRVSSSSSDEENGLAGTAPDGENAVAGELTESSARVEYETSSKRPKKRPGRAPPPFALVSASGALIQVRIDERGMACHLGTVMHRTELNDLDAGEKTNIVYTLESRKRTYNKKT